MTLSSRFRRSLILTFEAYVKGRKTFDYWRELEKSQWLSRQELDQIQQAGLRKLLNYASTWCPYYRDVWQELGLRPERVASIADFSSWPIITKDTIRRNRLAMRSTAPGIKLWPKATGGSSGIPLQFDFTSESNDRRMAAWYRGYTWAGAGPGTKQLYLWGVPLGDRPAWRRWKDSVYNGLIYRHRMLNTFDLSDRRVPEFLSAHNRFRPEVLVGYTNPLYFFARALKERELKPYSPRSIVVGAEKLHDFQRQLIEEVFQAPVFETYGSREFTLHAAECDRHEGLHLSAENLLVEILDDNGQPTLVGAEGNVVITDLYNYGMPFIRYENGDRAIAGWSACSCGRGLPLLKKVVGRNLDILSTPDGRRIPGEFFPHLLKDYPGVTRFQVVQENPTLICLKIVTRKDWREADESAVRCEVRKVIGDSVGFTIEYVEDIPLTGLGKFQVVVNKCSQVGRGSCPKI